MELEAVIDLDYITSMVHTMVEAHDRMYLDAAKYVRTIPIPTLGVNGTDFGISQETARALYASGEEAAEKFLASWDFEAYKAAFRGGAVSYSWRQDVTEYMRRVTQEG